MTINVCISKRQRTEGMFLNSVVPRKLMMFIPFDIMREILLRLPVSSLIRFRLVCKLWFSIIRDPQFIDIHLHRSRNTRLPSILFVPSFSGKDAARITRLDADIHLGSSVTETHFLFPEESSVNGSCNGLVCIVDCDDQNVRVLNPSTGESLTPPARTKSNPSCYLSKEVYLGFHPVTKEYKLVNFFADFDIHKANGLWIGCEVYTIGTTSWREIGRFYYRPVGHVLVSAKGFMYWSADMEEFRLLRFDLKSEVFDKMSPFDPIQFYQKRSRYQLGCNLVDLHGSIGIPVFPCSKTDEIPRMDLWVLSDDEHSWTRKYSVIYPWRYHSLPTPLLINQDRILLHVNKSRGWSKSSKAFCQLQYHHLRRGEDERGEDTRTSAEKVEIYQSCKFRPLVHIESLVRLPNVPTATEAAPSLVVPPTIRSCTQNHFKFQGSATSQNCIEHFVKDE